VSDADLDALDEPSDATTTGEHLHAAIRDWVSSVYGDEEPTIIPRFVVIAEADDGASRWLEVAAFGADGHCLPEWESIGLIEYARRVERREFASACDEDEDDDA
jgi:hypothetical protein